MQYTICQMTKENELQNMPIKMKRTSSLFDMHILQLIFFEPVLYYLLHLLFLAICYILYKDLVLIIFLLELQYVREDLLGHAFVSISKEHDCGILKHTFNVDSYFQLTRPRFSVQTALLEIYFFPASRTMSYMVWCTRPQSRSVSPRQKPV